MNFEQKEESFMYWLWLVKTILKEILGALTIAL